MGKNFNAGKLALSLSLLAVAASPAFGADNSIFTQSKGCLDALYAVYHPVHKMSDYLYYMPGDRKLVVPGTLSKGVFGGGGSEKVLFSSEEYEWNPHAQYVERKGSPKFEASPSDVWKALKEHITLAMDNLPSEAKADRAHLNDQVFATAVGSCRDFYNGSISRLAEGVKNELENRHKTTAKVESDSSATKLVKFESDVNGGVDGGSNQKTVTQ